MERNNSVKNEMILALNELSDILSSLDSGDQIQKILTEILTPSELEDLSLRWLLMKKLKQGIPQRKIAGELNISLCKITRGSKILQDPKNVCTTFITYS